MHGVVTVDDVGDVVVVHAAGEFDTFSVGVVIAALTQAETSGKDVLVDLRRVSFLDGMCLRAIEDSREHLQRHRKELVVTHAPPLVHRLAEALKITEIAGL